MTIKELQAKLKRIADEYALNPEKPSAELQHFLDHKKMIDENRAAIKSGSVVAQTKLELSRIAAIAETKASALKYAAAELTHATQGPASEADAAARLAICMACEYRAVEYKGMTDAEKGVGWCTKCGCGNSPRALLTVKVTLAGVECPLKKWSAVSGTGATVASAVDAVAGVAKSIMHKLSGG